MRDVCSSPLRALQNISCSGHSCDAEFSKTTGSAALYPTAVLDVTCIEVPKGYDSQEGKDPPAGSS